MNNKKRKPQSINQFLFGHTTVNNKKPQKLYSISALFPTISFSSNLNSLKTLTALVTFKEAF